MQQPPNHPRSSTGYLGRYRHQKKHQKADVEHEQTDEYSSYTKQSKPKKNKRKHCGTQDDTFSGEAFVSDAAMEKNASSGAKSDTKIIVKKSRKIQKH